MLGFRIFKEIVRSRYFKCTLSRLQSTGEAAPKENCGVTTRKFVKPVTTRELEILSDNFLSSLFSGALSKNIFQYPSVLRNEHIDIVLNHSAAVENFFSDCTNCSLSENILENLEKLELFGLSLPQEFGGAGYNETESRYLLECTAGVPSVARFLNYNENFGCKILNMYGSENQKKKYLQELAAGKSFVSFAYLENGPLIDFTKFEGYAFLNNEKNEYVLNSKKKWVHGADKTNLFLVLTKLPMFLEDAYKLKLKVFLVDRKTPGVTIHKLKSQIAQEMDLFEVSFENVSLPLENALGETPDPDGFTVLKYGLTHCNVGDAVICLHLVKRIINDTVQFIQNKYGESINFISDNLAYLITYAYALESVIYLITGRFDTYANPDLFDESVLAKIIALDSLQCAIQNYTQIFQRESLKQPGPLEEAMKAWQYYSVFDENIEYLKLMIASEGLLHGARYLRKTANAFLKPFDNPLEVLKWKFKSPDSTLKKYKLIQNFKMELNYTFAVAADALDLNCARLLKSAEELFVKYGDSALQNESAVIRFADVSAYIYAMIACLSRASSAVCYEFENFEQEERVAKAFTEFASSKIEWLIEEEMKNEKYFQLFRAIGKTAFKWKGYPAEHPLSRTY